MGIWPVRSLVLCVLGNLVVGWGVGAGSWLVLFVLGSLVVGWGKRIYGTFKDKTFGPVSWLVLRVSDRLVGWRIGSVGWPCVLRSLVVGVWNWADALTGSVCLWESGVWVGNWGRDARCPDTTPPPPPPPPGPLSSSITRTGTSSSPGTPGGHQCNGTAASTLGSHRGHRHGYQCTRTTPPEMSRLVGPYLYLCLPVCLSVKVSVSSLSLLRRSCSVQCCFTSTETIRTIRDGEPRTSTSTLTHLLSSVALYFKFIFALRPQRPYGLLGTGSPGRPSGLLRSS